VAVAPRDTPPPISFANALPGEVEVASTLAWLNAVAGVEGNYVLGLTVNTIGRRATADVVIPSDIVSGHHCTITNDGRQIVVIAESTTNGTYVNQEPIEPRRPVVLHTGDILGLGRGIQLKLFIPQVEQDGAGLKFRSAGWSDIGRRSNNEDVYDDGDHVIAVADGVGGRPAGELAAWLAVEGVRGARGTVDLSRAVHAINARIRDRGDSEPRRSGLASTLDAAVLSMQSGTPWVHGVHVGDGIALLQRPRRTEVVWLTRAHTLGAEMRTANPIALANTHPQAGRLMRAVGFADEVRPDEWQEPAEAGQRYIIASDGLINALGEAGLLNALAELRVTDPGTCARTLIAKAINAGADDNATVVVADVVPE
jgi:protein phosphatase